jgi:hypothetical protein
VIESVHDVRGSSTLGAPSPAQFGQTVRVFAWSLRSASSETFDNYEQMDTQSQRTLLTLLNLRADASNTEVSTALKGYSSTMMSAATARPNILVQQGQLKHHDIDTLAGESQVIRSISKSKDMNLAGCYEMRKVFTESKPSADWLTPEAAASWRRVGLTQTAPSVSPSLHASTKAFLLLDLVQRVSRLYVYEESNGGQDSELTEVVVSCPIDPTTFDHQ